MHGDDSIVDPEECAADVQEKYREVALHPEGAFHFQTGRPSPRCSATRRGRRWTAGSRRWSRSPGSATRSRCGRCQPASPSSTSGREAGSTASSPRWRSAQSGHVAGVDMTPEMLAKARSTAVALGLGQRGVQGGPARRRAPAEDARADVVISNGVINLCADKATVFAEAARVLRPGGVLQIADIVNGKPLPEAAVCQDRPVDRLHRRRRCPSTLSRRSRRPGSRSRVGLAATRIGGSRRRAQRPSLRRVGPRVPRPPPRHDRPGSRSLVGVMTSNPSSMRVSDTRPMSSRSVTARRWWWTRPGFPPPAAGWQRGAGMADRLDGRHPFPRRLHLRQPGTGGRRRRVPRLGRRRPRGRPPQGASW